MPLNETDKTRLVWILREINNDLKDYTEEIPTTQNYHSDVILAFIVDGFKRGVDVGMELISLYENLIQLHQSKDSSPNDKIP